MLTPPPQTERATLHERIERDKAFKPTGSPGSASVRIASLVAAAKARASKPKSRD